MSILTAFDTYFAHSFDSTRWTTGMNAKKNSYGIWSEWVVGLNDLDKKNGDTEFFFIVLRFGETSACRRSALYII